MTTRQTPAVAAAASATTTTTVMVHSGAMTAHACRLPPGADLVPSLQQVARMGAAVEVDEQSGSTTTTAAVIVLTCVGSVASLTLRMANAEAAAAAASVPAAPTTTPTTDTGNNGHCASCFRSWQEPLEIVSLVGTFAVNDRNNNGGDCCDDEKCRFHLHMAVSDASGNVYGGHLVSGTVHTTVELVLGSISSVLFGREHDPATGYRELVVSSSSSPSAVVAENKEQQQQTA
jgi:uncharacterized protein